MGTLFPERAIPAAVLDGAAGFAVLSVVKVSLTRPSPALAQGASFVFQHEAGLQPRFVTRQLDLAPLFAGA